MTRGKNDLPSLIIDFVEYCEIEKGLSPSTAQKYHYRLNYFLNWMGQEFNSKSLKVEDLNENLIRRFRLYLNRYINPRNNNSLKKSTQAHFLVALRSFLRYLAWLGIQTVSPERVEIGRFEAHSLKFLAPEQLIKLLESPDIKTIIGLRDRAILEVLFSTGLRVSELTNLNRDDINFKSQEFSVVGKGNRRRVVFLSDEAKKWLLEYLRIRNDQWKPLFINVSGVKRPKGSKNHEKSEGDIVDTLDKEIGEKFRLSVRSVQRLVKKYTHQAGIAIEVTPHTLRHTFATDLLSSGADLRVVQESLGHKNVSTTQIYTHVTAPQLKEAHRKFHRKWKKDN